MYLVYLWGGPLFFWKQGGENFFKTNNSFSVSLSVKTFFPVSSSCRQFFHACKKFSWAFFAFAKKIFPERFQSHLNFGSETAPEKFQSVNKVSTISILKLKLQRLCSALRYLDELSPPPTYIGGYLLCTYTA